MPKNGYSKEKTFRDLRERERVQLYLDRITQVLEKMFKEICEQKGFEND